MRRAGGFDLGLLLAAGATTAVLVRLDPAAGVLEWVFGTVLLVLAGYVVRVLLRAGMRARAERQRAARLAATEPRAVALAALEEERRRLGEEIAAALRETVAGVRDEVAALDRDDPRPGLRRIHERTQLATSELRRQLGLLRAAAPEPAPDPPGPAGRVPRRDLVSGGLLALLAAVEVTAYLLIERSGEPLLWSTLLTALAAACLVGRTVAPAAACFACAGVFAAGSLVGHPVYAGFWALGTLGGLLWTLAARGRPLSADLLAGAVLVTVVTWTRALDDPDNADITLAMMVVALLGGVVARATARREREARSLATSREHELAEAAREAVAAERAGFARELHDVTSHAVGLIAVQSGAAQVSWPHDRGAAQRSVALVEQTARAALAELDRLGAGRSAARGAADLHRLVARIRASGTAVELTLTGDLPPGTGPVVHRIVQESLTNAVRHAPGARVRVAVESGPDGVMVSVTDDGLGSQQGPVRGYGLVGLSERVALAGGWFRAGPAENGGFVVEARVPATRQAVTP